MVEAVAYSFELNPEMLDLLNKEFDVKKLAVRFGEAIKGKTSEEIETIGREFFTDYGTEWIRRTLQLGEEYPDRTYEMIKMSIDKTGGYYRFALLPQRFIEIAYLATQEFPSLPIVENNSHALVYKLVDCALYKSLKEVCGENVAAQLPCRHSCLTALKVLHQDLEIDAITGMDAEMPKDGFCQFFARSV
ncbi:MAG: hypothetical protein JW950_09890 [Deltaproteobacteria bacterium]|nr:hypothetical protein [Deltaproteobacteria bacterium]